MSSFKLCFRSQDVSVLEVTQAQVKPQSSPTYNTKRTTLDTTALDAWIVGLSSQHSNSLRPTLRMLYV